MQGTTRYRKLGGVFFAALLVVCLGPVAPATAVTPRSLGPAYSQLITDGVRYLAFKPQRDQLEVKNDQTGVVKQVPLADGCVPIYARYATFLVSCYADGAKSFLLLDTATGSLRPVPGAGSAYDPSSATLVRIGRNWIEGTDSSSGHPTRFYVNWHTGTRSQFGRESDLSDVQRDLDSPSLRAIGPSQFPVGFSDVDGSFVLRQAGRERFPRDYQDLVLYRNKRRVALLDRCHTYCGSVGVSGGRAIWSRGALGYGFTVKTRQRTHWRLPQSITVLGSGYGVSGIQSTSRHAFFNVRTLRTDIPPFLLYVARWPGAR
jgi:hypothetical protein